MGDYKEQPSRPAHPCSGQLGKVRKSSPELVAAVANVEFPLKMADIAGGQQIDNDIEACVRQLTSGEAVTTSGYVRLKEQLLVKDVVLFRSVKLPPNKVKEVPILSLL